MVGASMTGTYPMRSVPRVMLVDAGRMAARALLDATGGVFDPARSEPRE